MLRAGVIVNGEKEVNYEGVPQGNIASPVLANIYAHYALDKWFNEVVKHNCRGQVELFRYADDAVICCQTEEDADRIRRVLAKRLGRYDLKINDDKTHVVTMHRFDRLNSGTFDFLGFTFYIGLSQKGIPIYKVKTSGKKLRAKLNIVSEWCRKHRHRYRLQMLWRMFCIKLEGHIQYFGVSFNSKRVTQFLKKAYVIFWKWMNRRSQKRSMTMSQFQRYTKLYPEPKARICYKLF